VARVPFCRSGTLAREIWAAKLPIRQMMINKRLFGRTQEAAAKSFQVLLVVILSAISASADAILPTAFWISPITVLLLLPIIAIEAAYVNRQLRLGFWRATKVMGIANAASTLAGVPITLAVTQLQSKWMIHEALNHAMTPDPRRLGRHGLGSYPANFLVAASITLIICFLISWWIEYLVAHRMNGEAASHEISVAVRNANLLSYALLALVVLRLFSWMV
jgi:hypothetical protein